MGTDYFSLHGYMNELAYWIALNEFGKFGPRSFARLHDFFDSMKAAFEADANALTLAGIPKKTAEAFVHFRPQLDPQKLQDEIANNHIQTTRVIDDNYPALLKTIHDPPPIIFYQGTLPANESLHIAVVGSRKVSPYGISAAEHLSEALSRAGTVVVSGMAFGVDEIAHRSTIKTKGTTMAVLGSGLLNIGTSRQRYMARDIIENGGCVMSEFSVRAPGLQHHYPYRNRVVSGISHGTLVIEATEKSGSLITARSALEQGRDVFAVPGSIFAENSKGTNNLIKMGAIAITSADDIFAHLQIEQVLPVAQVEHTPDSAEEARILELLSKNPIHIDELTRTTQMAARIVAQTLSLMEMKGRTRQIGGMYYVLT